MQVSFIGSNGKKLAAKLDLPDGEVKFYAIFAHCFTGSKDFHTSSNISTRLAENGIAVLRFDFEGLGASEGSFDESTFSSNVGDILAAAKFLEEEYQAPALLVGHSLGGAAVLAAAGRNQIADLKTVATINAPSKPFHVTHHFHDILDEIEEQGEAEVTLAGRPFNITKEFVENIKGQDLDVCIGKIKQALMILHSPQDDTVGIENAGEIYSAAKHPKNFISLDGANHLLTDKQDTNYVADVISVWAKRYV